MALTKKPYKGCRDFFPPQMRIREYLFEHMKNVAELYGYEPYDGPLLEEVELYKAKSGEELINDQIYSFTDRGEREVAIRPEMTPTVARMVAQVHREVSKPMRWFSIPNLMRYEKPQRGRLREHWQFNCDIFGAPEGLGEFEILSLAKDLMKNLGANNTQFSILVNDRRVVNAVFENILKVDAETTLKLYKVIDKAKKVDEKKLDAMIAEHISGDTAKKLKDYLNLKSFAELKTFLSSNDQSDATTFLDQLHEYTATSDLDDYLEYDPTIVRGLDYYTGIVFEIFDKHPDNRRAICGGGAYANLLQIFNEDPLPGIGFGLGDVTLTDFLETHGLLPDLSQPMPTVFVSYQDDSAVTSALKVSSALRSIECDCETAFGTVKPKKLFQLAEKKGASFAVLIGSNELENDEFILKDLNKREEHKFKLSNPDLEAIEQVIYGA